MQAQDIQHIRSEAAPKDIPMKGMTLIVIPQKRKSVVDHWILIDAMRMQNELLVGDIYRVFPDDVDLSDVDSPLEMLRAFVGHYGANFSLETLPEAKMFEQLVVPKSED